MKKHLIIPMTLAMHTKLKWKAHQEGRSMSRVVRGLISEYLDGERNPESVAPDGTADDFYDYLHDFVKSAVEA